MKRVIGRTLDIAVEMRYIGVSMYLSFPNSFAISFNHLRLHQSRLNRCVFRFRSFALLDIYVIVNCIVNSNITQGHNIMTIETYISIL